MNFFEDGFGKELAKEADNFLKKREEENTIEPAFSAEQLQAQRIAAMNAFIEFHVFGDFFATNPQGFQNVEDFISFFNLQRLFKSAEFSGDGILQTTAREGIEMAGLHEAHVLASEMLTLYSEQASNLFAGTQNHELALQKAEFWSDAEYLASSAISYSIESNS